MEKLFIALALLTLYGCSSEQKLPSGESFFENTTRMEFVYVPGGCFQMGVGEQEAAFLKKEYVAEILSSKDEMRYWDVTKAKNETEKNEKLMLAAKTRFEARHEDEIPAHEVCVDPFYIGKYEVTQRQYQKIMNENPAMRSQNSANPVESVSWPNAVKFTELLGKGSGYKFRLPTEAEWEYAARAGTMTVRHFGDTITCNDALYANRKGDQNECRENLTAIKVPVGSTAPVGSYSPNGYGLYDVLGNVAEWCLDSYHSEMYTKSEKMNPLGTEGVPRVHRGGSLVDSGKYLRSSRRGFLSEDTIGNMIGFRVAIPQKLF